MLHLKSRFTFRVSSQTWMTISSSEAEGAVARGLAESALAEEEDEEECGGECEVERTFSLGAEEVESPVGAELEDFPAPPPLPVSTAAGLAMASAPEMRAVPPCFWLEEDEDEEDEDDDDDEGEGEEEEEAVRPTERARAAEEDDAATAAAGRPWFRCAEEEALEGARPRLPARDAPAPEDEEDAEDAEER